MLDYNNIEVMCLPLIRLRIVSVDNTIAVTKITSIYTKIQKHEFKATKINSDKKVQETISPWVATYSNVGHVEGYLRNGARYDLRYN